MTFREKILAVSLAISLILSLGFAVGQGIQFVGRVGVVGIFQKVPDDIIPLEFTPEVFNVGVVEENRFQNLSLSVRNPNTQGLNITWNAVVNQTIPLMAWMFIGNEIFGNSTFREIGPGETLNLTIQLEPGNCTNQCPVEDSIPFKIDIIFSGIVGPPPVDPGTEGFSIEILNVETFGGNGTINYNATYQNISSGSLQLDAVVRREARNSTFGFEPLDGQAEVLILAAGASEITSGEFSVLGIRNMVYQLQFEAITPPPGRPLAEIVRVNVVIQSNPPGVLAQELLPAGEPEGFVPEAVPEGELADPQLRTIGGVIPVELAPPILLFTTLGSGVTVWLLWKWRRRRKRNAGKRKVPETQDRTQS